MSKTRTPNLWSCFLDHTYIVLIISFPGLLNKEKEQSVAITALYFIFLACIFRKKYHIILI